MRQNWPNGRWEPIPCTKYPIPLGFSSLQWLALACRYIALSEECFIFEKFVFCVGLAVGEGGVDGANPKPVDT